jgi:hypothetical protein
VVAAIFEAELDAGQAARLAELMREHRETRPAAVVLAALHLDGARAELVAYWESREALESYLATGETPRGTALMREVGAEPTMRIVDVPQFA